MKYGNMEIWKHQKRSLYGFLGGGFVGNINSLQAGNFSAPKVNNIDRINRSNVSDCESVSPFSQIMSKLSEKEININDMFQAYFPTNSVSTQIGNCNVSRESWERNDFPVWQYFQNDSSAECLNNWKGIGTEPSQGNQEIQQGLDKIGFGEMVIIMPKSLQEKMESNPEYAKEILEKVQKWKTNYDRMDNGVAVSLGLDPVLSQMTKSYCIQIDENGNVGDYTVIGGGIDLRCSKETDETDAEVTVSKKVIAKSERKEVVNLMTNDVIIEHQQA